MANRHMDASVRRAPMPDWDSVVVLQMGGPRTLDDIEPFLRNLFRDQDVIRLPPVVRTIQPWMARRIARKRAPKVRPRYEGIGGGGGQASPIGELTRQQADALADRLGVPVHVCMRYTAPRSGEVVADLVRGGAKRVLLLPLYPQWSGPTTGSAVRDFAAAAQAAGLDADLHMAGPWFDRPEYLDAVAAACREQADPETHLVFSAHSLPQKYVRQGDPYRDHIEATAQGVEERLDGAFASVRLGFQSAVGPMKWLEPETEEHIDELAVAGAKRIALAPLGFVTDHIETLYDLDRKYRGQAEAHGMQVARVPSLNARPDFIDALVAVAGQDAPRMEPGAGAQAPPTPAMEAAWTR